MGDALALWIMTASLPTLCAECAKRTERREGEGEEKRP